MSLHSIFSGAASVATFIRNRTRDPFPTPSHIGEHVDEIVSVPSGEFELLFVDNPAPALFALIVGVDQYQDPAVRPLLGAIADAVAMQDFLMNYLRVSPGNIKTLLGEEATQSRIERSIMELAYNTDIKQGDPILIYFSGHGSEAPAPPGYPSETSDSKVQMFLPYDFVQRGTKDPIHGQGVLDITLARLLSELAKAKGDNITVISDCCHSGSVTSTLADEDEDEPSVRGVDLPDSYMGVLPGIFGSAQSEYKFFGNGSRQSHILLAACLPEEKAYENRKTRRGYFTQSLLELLQQPKTGVESISYEEAIEQMRDICLPESDKVVQHPQCEGPKKSRAFFNARMLTSKKRSYPVKRKGPTITMQAGEAHGVTRGSLFVVFADSDLSVHLGVLEVTTMTSFQSFMRFEVDTEPFPLETGFAVLMQSGDAQNIRILVPSDENLGPLWNQLEAEIQSEADPAKRNVQPVTQRSDAQIELSLTSDHRIEFKVLDEAIRRLGITSRPQTEPMDAKRIYEVLLDAASCYFALRRKSSSQIRASEAVRLECRKLVPGKNSEQSWQDDPTGENLIKSNTITIDDDPSARYGFKLENLSPDRPMYVAAFYFDMRELQISSYYQPDSAKNGRVDPSLDPKGFRRFGYRPRDDNPWGSDGMGSQGPEVQVGFFKIFLTSEYVNFSDIEVEKPTVSNVGQGELPVPKVEFWDTITVAVFRRRK